MKKLQDHSLDACRLLATLVRMWIRKETLRQPFKRIRRADTPIGPWALMLFPSDPKWAAALQHEGLPVRFASCHAPSNLSMSLCWQTAALKSPSDFVSTRLVGENAPVKIIVKPSVPHLIPKAGIALFLCPPFSLLRGHWLFSFPSGFLDRNPAPK